MLPIPPMMLTTGPVPAYPQVLAALGKPVLYDYDPAFQTFYAGVIEKLRLALRQDTAPVIMQGEAILGIEAAAAALIARDDVVLNLVSGVYGKGFAGWAARYGKEVIELAVPYDDIIDPQAVRDILRKRPDITIVSLCHHDTPSGTLNPLPEIGAIVAEHGAYLIVDAVSSFGGMDAHPQAHVDIFITSPSKCLGSTPGLSLIGVSERAWAKIEANPDAPRGSFLSVLGWKGASEPGKPFPVTPSIAEIYALDAALDLYAQEGPENVWARHAQTADITRKGLLELGLKLWPKKLEYAAPTATAFRPPEGFSDVALRDRLRDEHGILLSLGRADTAGKLLRVGHMGASARPDFARATISALSQILSRPINS
ncbi:alanine--glyoxylate aminotransferase family protein [Phyllobacterium sp. P30BS-XVII]|uniref:pyridoxamine--pyruvate transaminase n=1 Tax=Phyllobacterium sp. P30BS-XVII TaxID=2587046 RepID=UPI0017D3C8D1|nr:alanine--glyoxylate aminotransferase family protein [Phyllobacterium sp. P30BS-XVII]MBA8901434.1 pyridoxamine--pyruvate transaminase [Phyllobacterium sp. P30BS-XVII]